ncbi:MAG: prolipoprotein diacylglyceryl transferase family protein, partial [Agrococcus sp.]
GVPRAAAAVPAPGGDSATPQASPLRVSAFNCETLAEVEPHALGLTYEFEAAPEGDPYAVTIGFEGRRAGATREPGPGDRFAVSTTVDRVLPGSGRVAVTTRIPNLAPGPWQVVARPAVQRLGDTGAAAASGDARAVPPPLPGGFAEGATGWAPVINVRAPGVLLGAWPALVGLGAVVALIIQVLLAARFGLPVPRVVLVSLVACLVGLIGAKLYYLALYPAARRRALYGGGMCIQGFVLGAAAALMMGAWMAGIGIGSLLDITAPGLMFGMTIGRFGCFFGGCCVGRPTASRWGLWSSDRRLGARRIPTQLLEAALAAAIGVTTLVVLIIAGLPEPAGVVFVGTVAAYVVGRQLLLPLRVEPAKTRHGRALVLAAAATVLAADLVVVIAA